MNRTTRNRLSRLRRRPLWLVLLALVFCLPAISSAAPGSPTDETKVPHYFGPYANWANSPLTQADATVAITDPTGTGATATAQVGVNGAVTGLTITDPGSGYSAPTVAIGGSGSGATATADFSVSGAVTKVAVDTPGAGYTKPAVAFTGGGGTGAAATAYGGVDAVQLVDAGTGYTFPTVAFDLPDDPNGVQAQGHADCVEANCQPTNPGDTVNILGVTVDDPGSGYSSAPGVAILDGTQFDPVTHDPTGPPFLEATVTSTLSVQSVTVDTFGTGYTAAPTVDITDPTGTGSGATATASIDVGAITALTLVTGGSGYVTPGGIKKFTDELPMLCDPTVGGSCVDNANGQHLPLGVPDTTTFPNADYYVIALVQHRAQMSSSLPQGTLVREYVQLKMDSLGNPDPSGVALSNDLLDGSSTPVLLPNGMQAYGVDSPQYLGPVIVAQKDKAVRIVFYNLLPTGDAGDLFLPTDSSMMGSGMGPMNMAAPPDQGSVMDGVRNPECTEYTKGTDVNCFKDNRATLHLHGGVTPWISDGTPHQWITPANENTPWPQGVSVQNVPDMVGGSQPANVPDCAATSDGCQTFYYTNQQSARLMFYHDHAWGITRLNVYAGEAAGYVITDPTEQKLFGSSGAYPSLGEGIPLIIQDRTFVPSDAQLLNTDPNSGPLGQDPTWDQSRWGGEGNLWYHHVYMPAQNPGDPSGLSAFGRWMYGPWFWPPATPTHGPIANPYYDPSCNLDDPATWQYQSDPFCEPQQIPGTPNISAGMEQFNDTPIVNGTAYPTLTVDPKAYRFRILNAANDRFFNLQWYVGDPNSVADPTIGPTEVALKPAEVAAAQTDPNVFPTPDTTVSPKGPNFVQIGSEGGFLPAPTVVPNQPITWITDPTRFDFGNVDQHALAMAPAERADTIVDFSQYAGQTLILYNDAPAAYPARVACYDYYTGGPDLTPACAPSTLPGYGPNTRTIMQVKVSSNAADPAFDVAALKAKFTHKANNSGVFEAGQHPIIIGQAAYNSAYGKTFASSGNCTNPNGTNKCDGFARINQQGGDQFRFDTLRGPQLKIPLQPKAIHDEMNAASFDEFGRMTANLGVEAVPASPAAQNITLYPFVNPQTELIDATGLPVGDVSVTAISKGDDGTQIWKITHNGVDTHPIHFHLYDVQVLNRVTWDNIIIPPDPNELGWKDTVRMSPLEDTIVALRPVIPKLPFEIPNSVRPLNPMMPLGDTSQFNNVDPNGNPTANIVNKMVNFGWEYVFHCHILSHEEMDMMRPVTVAVPPIKADGLAASVNKKVLTLSWNDNSINETSFLAQTSTDGTTWTDVATLSQPLAQSLPTGHGLRSLVVSTNYNVNNVAAYRVVAQNTVGYGAEFPSMTVKSTSDSIVVGNPPAAPTKLSATLQSGPQVRLTFTDNAQNEAWFVIERAVGTGPFAAIATAPARNGTGSVTYTDTTVSPSTTYSYRVAARNLAGGSSYSNTATVAIGALPGTPAITNATAALAGNRERVTVTWTAGAPTNQTGFTVQWSATSDFATIAGSGTTNASARTFTTGQITSQVWYVRVFAQNAVGPSPFSAVTSVPSA